MSFFLEFFKWPILKPDILRLVSCTEHLVFDSKSISWVPFFSETTEGKQFDILLEKVANHGRTLYRLFQQPSHTIIKGAGLLMKAIIEEASPETAQRMQQLALAEGALPIHLLRALYTKTNDNRLLMHAQLSKHLVGLWTTNCDDASKLLERMFPAGLLTFLNRLVRGPGPFQF